jgi:Leucine-rich repeat (LRR) protein
MRTEVEVAVAVMQDLVGKLSIKIEEQPFDKQGIERIIRDFKDVISSLRDPEGLSIIQDQLKVIVNNLKGSSLQGKIQSIVILAEGVFQLGNVKSEVAVVEAPLTLEDLHQRLNLWESEAPPKENREGFKREILEFLKDENSSKELVLVNYKVSELPDIFEYPVFSQKLEKLNLSHNPITLLPESIGRCKALKELNLFSTQILSLPESIIKCTNLEVLNLTSSFILSLPDQIGQCVALKKIIMKDTKVAFLPDSIGNCLALEELDLTLTRVNSLPESIGNCVALKKLTIAYNWIRSLPDSIGQLQNLTSLYLYKSGVMSLPNSILELPRACHIEISRSSLSEDVETRLRTLAREEGYNGPQFQFSMTRRKLPRQQALSVEQLIDGLYKAANQEKPLLENISREDQELNSWLNRLSWIADYKAGGENKDKIVNMILVYLEAADRDEDFRSIFQAVINSSSETCGDRIALSLLDLGIAYDLSCIDPATVPMPELAMFLKSVWSFDILKEVAKQKVNSLLLVDEIEVYLGYPIQLQSRLNLPLNQTDMLYFTVSEIDPQDLDTAQEYVENKISSREHFCEYLLQRDVWNQALNSQHSVEVQVLEDAKREGLAVDDPDYEAIGQAYNQGMNQLTQNIISL